jgi:hypothetical protein
MKRLFTLLVIATIIVTYSGCSSDNGTNSTSSTHTVQTEYRPPTVSQTMYQTPSLVPTTSVPTTSQPWQDIQAKKIVAAIDPTNPITRNYAVQLAAQFPGAYNVSQICAIWDWVYAKWRYVNDPNGNDYYAAGSESINNNLAGDCDDFAIEIASLIEAIGGSARVVCAYNTTSDSHAYPEVAVGKSSESLTSKIIQDIANQYSATIWYEIDISGYVWLNLDWSAGHPGGPFFAAQKYVAFRSNGYWQDFVPFASSTAPSITKIPHKQVIANSTEKVSAGSYISWDLAAVSGAVLTGAFTASGGSGNDIKVYIFNATSFVNWKNGQAASTLYNSGQVTKGDFQVNITSAGTYYIVFDNSFSIFSSKNVAVYATLDWIETVYS